MKVKVRRIEAMFVELGDVVVWGKDRLEVYKTRFQSGGLGDSINLSLRNLKTGDYAESGFLTHDCIVEVELTDEQTRSRLAGR